jgi:3-hydroxybutyryl-CoA dehydrogenase
MVRVAVIGAGTMGHSLAQVFAQGGYSVVLHDLSREILLRAQKLMEANLETLAEAGLFDPTQKEEVLQRRIRLTTDLPEAVSDADLVLEAVFEDPQVKKELFSRLDELCNPHAVLASNTSYLNVFEIVKVRNPERLLITHWFAPPHIIPLVEIVPGPKTSAQTVETVRGILTQLGKEPLVLKRFMPGFVANRLQMAVTLEMYHLLDQGVVSPEELDRAVKTSFGLRIPILGLAKRVDFAGLDMAQRALRNRSYRPPPVRGRSDVVDALVSQGRLGVKSGKGFYDYGGRSTEEILRERDLKLLKLMKFLKELGEL